MQLRSAFSSNLKFLKDALVPGDSSTDSAAAPEPKSDKSAPSDFHATLMTVFDQLGPGQSPGGQVSEEKLFAAIINERVTKKFGDQAGESYRSSLIGLQSGGAAADGAISNQSSSQISNPISAEVINGIGSTESYEDLAKGALKQLVLDGRVTAVEGDLIYAEAFTASQLDDNNQALFDDRGGENDPTIAVALTEEAINRAAAVVAGFDDGTTSAEVRGLNEATLGASNFRLSTASDLSSSSNEINSGDTSKPTASSESGSNAFLFKPVSDSTGKLAILTPSFYSGSIESVTLKDLLGNKIEQGAYGGNGNGGRDHFRFTKPGKDYPDQVKVELQLKSGEVVRYSIADSSIRYEQ